MEEIKKTKIWRFILRIAFFIISIILPTVLMITHFEIAEKVTSTQTKVTFYGFLILFILFTLLWKFKNKLFEWIKTWEYSYMKYFFIGFSKIWIFILLAIVIISTKTSMLNYVKTATDTAENSVSAFFSAIEFCIITVTICEIIAYLIISPIEEKLDYKIKRYQRKQERKEDYKEALQEIEESKE